ncbi:unnamed protein product [Parnassius apollo]|uniref:(apollo) hypothetical protein n=1 Tax=Parnassius apollo TaxID=110799 RepID=A0A8S3Y6S3_PARAO|nr:unnamed protein product [Parnassius apollo]
MFEQKNVNMRALIEALQAPKANNHVDLPEFNPDKADTDPRPRCATTDLCFAENLLHGVQLVLAVSKALKGTASTWLSQTAYQGMSWSEFKILFTTRFISTETLAATLISLSSDKPSEKETLVAYASRLMTSLTNRWKDANKEQIVVATVLAHISQFDSRLQRLAFTTDITSRDRLQQELHVFPHLKRKINTQGEFSNAPDGHRRSECKSKPMDSRRRPTTSLSLNQTVQQPPVKPLVCLKCGKPGHIVIRCTNGGSLVESCA